MSRGDACGSEAREPHAPCPSWFDRPCCVEVDGRACVVGSSAASDSSGEFTQRARDARVDWRVALEFEMAAGGLHERVTAHDTRAEWSRLSPRIGRRHALSRP